jgi:hypothetical protein
LAIQKGKNSRNANSWRERGEAGGGYSLTVYAGSIDPAKPERERRR